MKGKKLFAACSAIAIGVTALSLAACKDPNPPAPPPPPADTFGLPVAAAGHYIKDSDLIADGNNRYLLYTTNETTGETDNAIAVSKGTFEEGEGKGWKYGEGKIVLSGSLGKWDENIGSASLVKGEFALGESNYSWLMAYCATKEASERQYNIGLAVAEAPDGEWTKISETPLVAFDADVYGATSMGCYAPSLVNLDKSGNIRLFYTYADAYGHFAKFVDFDASDLGAIELSGEVQCPNNGQISGGDSVNMFPNADFAYDSAAKKFYTVKDYSPAAATKPNYAERIQLLNIEEKEFYTAEVGEGWKGLRTWDFSDTDDGAWERIYGACIVCDAYGQIDGSKALEIVYNVCELEMDNENWEFTQNLKTFHYNPVA